MFARLICHGFGDVCSTNKHSLVLLSSLSALINYCYSLELHLILVLLETKLSKVVLDQFVKKRLNGTHCKVLGGGKYIVDYKTEKGIKYIQEYEKHS